MKEENNEIVETEGENVEKEESVVDSQPKKKKKSGIIVPIFVAIVAFVIVYGGITLYNNLSSKNDAIEKDELKDEYVTEDVIEKDEAKDEGAKEDVIEKDDSVVEDSAGEAVGKTTGPDEVITITDAMKAELNKIANIGDGYCYVQKLFYNMNGLTKDLTAENKKYMIISYYLLSNSGSNKINETTFNEIANKYSITDSFDTVMAGFEKVGDDYVIPPMGCVGPEKETHNTTYQDTGNTITVIDNVTITNTETNETDMIKVIYTFIYSKDSNNNITFKLHQVNSEK